MSKVITFSLTKKTVGTVGFAAVLGFVLAGCILLIPDAPKNVVATAHSASGVTVAWSSVSSATGYHIYRSTNEFGIYQRVGNTSTELYTEENADELLANTKYFYKISSFNYNGESPQSSAASVITWPTVPEWVSSKDTMYIQENPPGTGRILLFWNSVQGATQYNIYRSADSDEFGDYSLIGETRLNSYVDFITTNRQTAYFYRVTTVSSTDPLIESAPLIGCIGTYDSRCPIFRAPDTESVGE